MHGRKLTALALGVVALSAAGPAMASPPTSGAAVCNEAENSPRGGYVVTGGPVDPVPPAFLRGSQMKVGNGVGLENAAERSPALRTCAPPSDGGGDGDTGGGDVLPS